GYATAVRDRVAAYPFRYADVLARRMRVVFLSTRHPALKAEALRATLIAAVELNRYAAMHVFNRMLTAVATVDYALPVAEMLRDHPTHYAVVADGAPADRLHAAIRDLREVVLSGDLPPTEVVSDV